MDNHRITSVHFSKYKAFRDFSFTPGRFNVLVGPNNAGKSTILGAFRILSEGIRKARSKAPTLIESPTGQRRGYEINLDNIPVATENVFFDYDESEPAIIKFNISNKNNLKLVFPAPKVCYLFCETQGKIITSPSLFKNAFPIEIGFVPILGPVEHNEQLYQKDAAREALLTHRASRNFRNIWHHYQDKFSSFKEMLQLSWPGMDIQLPEVDYTHEKPMLRMFCPEGRIPREIFWSGFGFQVWCQMLTFIISNSSSTMLLIDEPDIYLHSDLQRQLISILKSLGPDILLATHSTEIISEVDSQDLYLISKKFKSAKPVKSPEKIKDLFQALGSNTNPILTQIAKTKKLVFVEGKDFQILSKFAAKLQTRSVALRSDFAVIPAGGYNTTKVKSFTDGVKSTLGEDLIIAVVFDRDYRSNEEVNKDLTDFLKFAKFAYIHPCKEIENYLFVPSAIEKAIKSQLVDRKIRSGKANTWTDSILNILLDLTDQLKEDLFGQWYHQRSHSFKTLNKSIDDKSITSKLFKEFNDNWINLDYRLKLIPGKELLANLNTFLQAKYSIVLTPHSIIEAMNFDEIPSEIKSIIKEIDLFSKMTT